MWLHLKGSSDIIGIKKCARISLGPFELYFARNDIKMQKKSDCIHVKDKNKYAEMRTLGLNPLHGGKGLQT